MKRRTALAWMASAALGPTGVVRADDGQSDPGRRDAYEAAVRAGEAALARGDTDDAIAAFESAARMRHAADSEMGLVRAAMQRGRYREALGFCAHVAGAHPETPAAAALYAWLLRVGGQERASSDILEAAIERSPADAVLRAAREALGRDWPTASRVLLEPPSRMAPESWSPARATCVLRSCRTVCSAVVVAQGTRALIPEAVLPSIVDGRTWIRNGLGETTRATIDEAVGATSGLAVLRLAEALSVEAGPPVSRAPFAGSPGFAVQFAIDADGAPAWPFLWRGFLGSQSGAGLRRLGIEVPQGHPGGGAVLDAVGRIAGATMADRSGALVFVPAPDWPAGLGDATAPVARTRLLPLDEAYERALQAAAQVVVGDEVR